MLVIFGFTLGLYGLEKFYLGKLSAKGEVAKSHKDLFVFKLVVDALIDFDFTG